MVSYGDAKKFCLLVKACKDEGLDRHQADQKFDMFEKESSVVKGELGELHKHFLNLIKLPTNQQLTDGMILLAINEYDYEKALGVDTEFMFELEKTQLDCSQMILKVARDFLYEGRW